MGPHYWVRLNKRLKSPIGFISDRYCESRGLTNDTIGLSAEIVLLYEPLRCSMSLCAALWASALLYEPLRCSIFTINPIFSGRKSLRV